MNKNSQTKDLEHLQRHVISFVCVGILGAAADKTDVGVIALFELQNSHPIGPYNLSLTSPYLEGNAYIH